LLRIKTYHQKPNRRGSILSQVPPGVNGERENVYMALRAIAKKHDCVLHGVDFEKREIDLRSDHLESIFNARDEMMDILEKTDF